MVKELKQLPSIDGLECSDSVKHKTKEFVRKYMSKYGDTFKRDPNDTKEYWKFSYKTLLNFMYNFYNYKPLSSISIHCCYKCGNCLQRRGCNYPCKYYLIRCNIYKCTKEIVSIEYYVNLSVLILIFLFSFPNIFLLYSRKIFWWGSITKIYLFMILLHVNNAIKFAFIITFFFNPPVPNIF